MTELRKGEIKIAIKLFHKIKKRRLLRTDVVVKLNRNKNQRNGLETQAKALMLLMLHL